MYLTFPFNQSNLYIVIQIDKDKLIECAFEYKQEGKWSKEPIEPDRDIKNKGSVVGEEDNRHISKLL
jgi:hypothetical protein